MLEALTRRIEWYNGEKFESFVVTASRGEIAQIAIMTAYENGRNGHCNVCWNDEKGHGFPDETFGDWGSFCNVDKKWYDRIVKSVFETEREDHFA